MNIKELYRYRPDGVSIELIDGQVLTREQLEGAAKLIGNGYMTEAERRHAVILALLYKLPQVETQEIK